MLISTSIFVKRPLHSHNHARKALLMIVQRVKFAYWNTMSLNLQFVSHRVPWKNGFGSVERLRYKVNTQNAWSVRRKMHLVPAISAGKNFNVFIKEHPKALKNLSGSGGTSAPVSLLARTNSHRQDLLRKRSMCKLSQCQQPSILPIVQRTIRILTCSTVWKYSSDAQQLWRRISMR